MVGLPGLEGLAAADGLPVPLAALLELRGVLAVGLEGFAGEAGVGLVGFGLADFGAAVEVLGLIGLATFGGIVR